MAFTPPPKLLPGSADLIQLKAALLITGLQTKDNALFQVIDKLISFSNKNIGTVTAAVIQNTTTINNLAINVREEGYWTPLIMDGEDNGDSELVLNDGNEPIAIWTPTPV